MTYVPDPTDPTRPTGNDPAGDMYLEFQALKGYIQTLLAGGTEPFVGLGGFRNRILNGDFSIRQRGGTGTISAGAAAYTVDQWLLGTTGAAANWATNLNAGTVPNKADFAISQPGGSGVFLTNRIEHQTVQDFLGGRTVTVSGWYQSDSVIEIPTVGLQTPGAQDNWASAGIIGAIVPILDSAPAGGTWTYFKRTFTLTQDAINGLAVIFQMTAGFTGTIYFSAIQVELGSFASSFEVLPPAVQLGCCQRYYQIGQIFAAGYAITGVQVGCASQGNVYMRAIPEINITGNSSNNVSSLVISASILNPPGNVEALGTCTTTGAWNINAAYNLSVEL